MEEPREAAAASENLLEWVTPELIVEDVKSVTQGGGTYRIAGTEDVVASYYTSS